jgi:hypothetical protein
MNNSMICKDGKGFLLLLETASSVYFQLMDSIKEPYKYQKTFAIASKDTKLEVAFIELRRELSSRFITSMYNVAHIYGGKDVAFSIVCHIDVVPIVEEILGNSWKNVRVIPRGNKGQIMAITDYNLMLTSLEFWDNFDSQFVLITHIDSVLFRPVDDWAFEYDLVGAPWPSGEVGNGGYTLRNVSVMKTTVQQFSYSHEFSNATKPEDLWIHDHLKKLPSVDLALQFSVEQYTKPNIVPTGGHQLFLKNETFISTGNAFRLLQRFCNPI